MNTVLSLFIAALILSQTACTALVVGGGATVAAIATDKRTTGSIVEDENIEIKFTYQYYQSKHLNENTHINITSYNGWVLLTGEAPTESQRQELYNLASGITNVKRVYNEITLATPSSLRSRSTDAYLTSKIKTMLLADKETNGYHVKVVTESGVVYLMGLITPAAANKSVDIVRNIRGVKKVIKLFDYQSE